jgi:hypothetical protein
LSIGPAFIGKRFAFFSVRQHAFGRNIDHITPIPIARQFFLNIVNQLDQSIVAESGIRHRWTAVVDLW